MIDIVTQVSYDGDMDLSQDHKDEIGMQLTRRLGQLLKDGILAMDEVSEVADYILANIDALQTHEHYVNFLLELNTKWPYFETTLKIEQGVDVADQDKQKAEQMAQFIKNKQLDRALSTAQTG